MTRADYERRFAENQKIFGTGLETSMSVPCPFCAAPDFMRYKIIEVREVMSQNHVCKECGRGSKALFATAPGTVQFEMVQTQGEDPPDFLPVMRRA